ncbi:response regulator transcription factor [Bradyrhizobium lablabi]|uniref:response regulator transcription factor n=1 Tax=Bradyrhizobium lablabi TaxID=722472 RepID=UPI001BA9E765|nr:response regulator [Bradyrhizobium lablabi]MBR0696628.1 response regulator [Bradyrhizobium lablabi]
MAEASLLIAIVDDDPAVLKGLSRLLRSHAFRVLTYGSGREFLAALPAGLPDCLIVDLQMPEMNGLELQRHLASSGIKIPTILITAYDDDALRDHGGLVASLRKPLQQQALFEAIDRAVSGSRSAG